MILFHAVDNDFSVTVSVRDNIVQFLVEILELNYAVDKTVGIYDFVCKKVDCGIEFAVTVFYGRDMKLLFKHVAEILLKIAEEIVVTDDGDRSSFLRDTRNIIGKHVRAGFVNGKFGKFAARNFYDTLSHVHFGSVYRIIYAVIFGKREFGFVDVD